MPKPSREAVKVWMFLKTGTWTAAQVGYVCGIEESELPAVLEELRAAGSVVREHAGGRLSVGGDIAMVPGMCGPGGLTLKWVAPVFEPVAN